MEFTCLFFIVFIAASYGQSDVVCPLKEDIKPCICTVGKDKMPWVTCSGLSSSKKLLRAVDGMANFKFTNFYLEESTIGVLPSDIFRNIEIQSLNIMFVNISDFSESVNKPPFLGLERSLESLEIKESFLSKQTPLTRLSLSHLKKLTLLQLESNIIPTIGNDWFESGPYGLKELYFLDSYINKLGSHAFNFLNDLKKISLTGGSISEVTREMFPNKALSLEAIDLSNNKLSVLPKDLFYKMPSLTEVYLDSNNFKGIEEIVWAPVWSQLSHVFVDGNAINCDDDLRWIYKYRLPETLHGTCTFPGALKGKDLSKLTLTDFEEKRTT